MALDAVFERFVYAVPQSHGALKVSLQALYDKVQPTEPQVVWESVRGCAERRLG